MLSVFNNWYLFLSIDTRHESFKLPERAVTFSGLAAESLLDEGSSAESLLEEGSSAFAAEFTWVVHLRPEGEGGGRFLAEKIGFDTAENGLSNLWVTNSQPPAVPLGRINS